jgi:hypothetical protein
MKTMFLCVAVCLCCASCAEFAKMVKDYKQDQLHQLAQADVKEANTSPVTFDMAYIHATDIPSLELTLAPSRPPANPLKIGE